MAENLPIANDVVRLSTRRPLRRAIFPDHAFSRCTKFRGLSLPPLQSPSTSDSSSLMPSCLPSEICRFRFEVHLGSQGFPDPNSPTIFTTKSALFFGDHQISFGTQVLRNMADSMNCAKQLRLSAYCETCCALAVHGFVRCFGKTNSCPSSSVSVNTSPAGIVFIISSSNVVRGYKRISMRRVNITPSRRSTAMFSIL